MKGRITLNSGATFGENDVVTDYCEIEAKTTKHQSFKVDLKEFKKLERKCHVEKLPIMVVDLEDGEKSLAVLNYDDLLFLIEKRNA